MLIASTIPGGIGAVVAQFVFETWDIVYLNRDYKFYRQEIVPGTLWAFGITLFVLCLCAFLHRLARSRVPWQ